jgi:SAM-dependent methyltransferase
MTNSEPHPDGERHEVWSRYWAHLAEGGATAGSFAGGYSGTAIERWWEARIGRLEDRLRWLDVATGNGAVPLIWARVNCDPLARCDAVDLARIGTVEGHRIAWHSGVHAEHLPFDAASFDVAMSQYGFEYMRRTEAVAELARVLRPGGSLLLVMHHAGGHPARMARTEVGHIDELTGPDGLWTLAVRMIEPIARSASPAGRAALMADPTAEALRQAFSQAQERLRGSAHASACPDVLYETSDAVGGVLQRAVGDGAHPAQLLAQRWTRHLQDSRLRLVELGAHALDEAGAADLCRILEIGFRDIQLGTLHERGHLMGWTLIATRG